MTHSLNLIKGVFSSGISAGIKAKGGLDLAYIYAPNCLASAGVFTRNQFKATCVERNQKIFDTEVVKLIIVNSGNANAVTGINGVQNNLKIAEEAGKLLDLNPNQIATASTGIIGKQLPIDAYLNGLQNLLNNPLRTEAELTSQAILTTDTKEKTAIAVEAYQNFEIKVAGIAKGSGMIAPNMATMLGFIATNYPISSQKLKAFLSKACNYSFNLISVDSDTSTNDMVLCLSVPEDNSITTNDESDKVFYSTLLEVCTSLATQIVIDGEGATRLIKLNLTGARNYDEAKTLGLSVINSPLVKTAIHGADPNWGRVLSSLGKAGVSIDTNLVQLKMQSVLIVDKGQPLDFNRQELHQLLKSSTVEIDINLSLGSENLTCYGCDLTHGYVDINVEYN